MLGEPLGTVVLWKVEDHGWSHEVYEIILIIVLIIVLSASPRPMPVASSASVVVRVRVTPAMRHG